MDLMLGLVIAGGAVAVSFALAAKSRPFSKKTAPTYKKKRLLNGSELKLHGILERWRRQHAKHLHLACQVSYGAFIGAKDRTEWNRVRFKMADFVFYGPDGYVRAIVEYDGHGHSGNSKADFEKVRERDQIKNDAAIAANIPLIRVPPEISADMIAETLTEVLCPPQETVVIK
jgi:hypothetical protein